MMGDWSDEPVRLRRGLRNGLLLALPVWAAIVGVIYAVAG